MVGLNKTKKSIIKVIPRHGIKYVIPQYIIKGGDIKLTFRVKKPGKLSHLCICSSEKMIFEKDLRYTNPANLINVKVPIAYSTDIKTLEVKLNGS